jgi:hypothetical protein
MCDYSLHTVESRPARVGDKLITTKFPGSLTRGFSAVDQPNVAVCLLPGTEIVFEESAKYGLPLAQFIRNCISKRVSRRAARFRQIHMHDPQTHHDALEFADGKVVLLTNLCCGQRATVLQLPAKPPATKAPNRQEHALLLS